MHVQAIAHIINLNFILLTINIFKSYAFELHISNIVNKDKILNIELSKNWYPLIISIQWFNKKLKLLNTFINELIKTMLVDHGIISSNTINTKNINSIAVIIKIFPQVLENRLKLLLVSFFLLPKINLVAEELKEESGTEKWTKGLGEPNSLERITSAENLPFLSEG